MFFFTQSYFAVLKNIKINSTQYFIMKILNKQELQKFAFNEISDIDLTNVMSLYKKCTAKSYLFLVIDIALSSDNIVRFKKDLLERI